MDYFGVDGTLSDEIILNILVQVPSAPSFLSLGATCSRLRDICRFEEDRYNFWRFYYAWKWRLNPQELLYFQGEKGWKEFYATRSRVIQGIRKSTAADDGLTQVLKALVDVDNFDRSAIGGVIEAASRYLFDSPEMYGSRKKKFLEAMGPQHVLYCVALAEGEPTAQSAALVLLFRLLKEDDKIVKEAIPWGAISIFARLLNSDNAECRRVSLGLLWAYSLNDESICEHFGHLDVVEPLIKLLYSDATPAVLCSISILSKCIADDAVHQMRSHDILPRLIELLESEEHSIKCGAMRLIPKFEKARVGELGGISKLVKVVHDYHDKIESVTMMAMIVMEYLSHDEENKMIMGKDETIPTMVSVLSSEKSELQKQAMLILSSLTENDINSRRIRQQSGLDALVGVIERTDLPDVQHACMHCIVDITADIIESGTLESVDALKRLELSLDKLCSFLSSKTHHFIVREAAASVLDTCVTVLNLSPKAASEVARAALTAIDAGANPDPTLPKRAAKSVSQMLSAALSLLARIAEHYPSIFASSGELVDSTATLIPSICTVINSTPENPSLLKNAMWALTMLLQVEKFAAILAADEKSVSLLVKPSAERENSSDILSSSIALGFLALAQKQPAAVDWEHQITSALEQFATNATSSRRFFSLTAFVPFLQSSHSALVALGTWLAAHISHSAQGRRRVKQQLNQELMENIKTHSTRLILVQSLLNTVEKNMSVSSVFI